MNSLSKGIIYTAIPRYFGVFLSIIINSILSRVLLPGDFGIIAIVLVIITFFNILVDLGIGPAIIQRNNETEGDLSSFFSFTFYVGLLLGIIFFFISKPISLFYDNSDLVLIIKSFSLVIFTYSISIVPLAVLRKKLQFRKIGLIQLFAQVMSGIIAISIAYGYHTVHALVLKSVVHSFVVFVLTYFFTRPKLTLFFDLKPLREISHYSFYQFSFNFINYFSRNSDNILIGKFLGMNDLGYYEKSYSLMLMPIQNLTHVITPVIQPVLSKYQDNLSVVYKEYIKLVSFISIIGFPLSIFLFFGSSNIIILLFGDNWFRSIEIFKILSLSVGFQMVMSTSGSILQAINKTKTLFHIGIISSLITVSSILLGIFYFQEVNDVAFMLVIAFITNFIISFFVLINNELKQSVFSFAKIFIPSILTSLILYTVNQFYDCYYDIDNLYIDFTVKIIIYIVIIAPVYIRLKILNLLR